MSRRLDGKVALITGGANGIGLACALRFADEGAAIVVADVLDDAGSKAVAAVAEHGAEGLFVHLDASRAEENHAVVKTAVERFGGLDILVTAAGILHAAQRSGDIGNDTEYVKTHRAELGQPGAALAALTIDEWRRVIDVNLTGTMLAVQATAASMIQTGRSGSIITISSIGGKHLAPVPSPIRYPRLACGCSRNRPPATGVGGDSCQRHRARVHPDQHDGGGFRARSRQKTRCWRKFRWAGWAVRKTLPTRPSSWRATSRPI